MQLISIIFIILFKYLIRDTNVHPMSAPMAERPIAGRIATSDPVANTGTASSPMMDPLHPRDEVVLGFIIPRLRDRDAHSTDVDRYHVRRLARQIQTRDGNSLVLHSYLEGWNLISLMAYKA